MKSIKSSWMRDTLMIGSMTSTNTSNAREHRANEAVDVELEYERVYRKRYEDFQEWLNQCPLVVTDYQDYTDEFTITFNLKAD